MTHFVPDPAPANYGVPTEFTLTISETGSAAVNVWFPNPSIPENLEIRLQGRRWMIGGDPQENRRDSQGKINPPSLFRFELQGLKEGDKIAAFIGEDQHTLWLPIGGKSDRRVCKFLPNISYESNQPASESNKWMEETDAAIKTILGYKVGAVVLGALKEHVLIRFDVNGSATCAGARRHVAGAEPIKEVIVTPAGYPGSTAPGGRYDEIILHEITPPGERSRDLRASFRRWTELRQCRIFHNHCDKSVRQQQF